MSKLSATRSSGIIDSEVCLHFAKQGWEIHGFDHSRPLIRVGETPTTQSKTPPTQSPKWAVYNLNHQLKVREFPAGFL